MASHSMFLVWIFAISGFQLLQTSSRSAESSNPVARSPGFTCSSRSEREAFTGYFLLRLRGGGDNSKSVRSDADSRKRIHSSKSGTKPFKKRTKKWKRKKRAPTEAETVVEQDEESSTAHVYGRTQEQGPAILDHTRASLNSHRADIKIGGGANKSENQVRDPRTTQPLSPRMHNA
jgi:hypothetical protein